MKRFLFATGVFALVVASVALAQDPKPDPAQPEPKAAKAAKAVVGKAVQLQPAQPGIIRVTPAKMAQLEEDFETLEAHRDVRKAHVRAAEVAIKAAEINLDLLGKGGNIPAVELAKAKLEVEAAKAQLEIRIAEMKEVEVKVKYAKKRLDDAKGGVAPGAVIRPNPKQVDPPPQ